MPSSVVRVNKVRGRQVPANLIDRKALPACALAQRTAGPCEQNRFEAASSQTAQQAQNLPLPAAHLTSAIDMDNAHGYCAPP